jgi:hypothetical protein
MENPGERAFDCKSYPSCLAAAARADLPLSCPCDRFRRDPAAVHLRDLSGCEILLLAVLAPRAFDLFQAMMALRDRREKELLLARERAAVARELHPGSGSGRDHRNPIPNMGRDEIVDPGAS